VFKGRCKAVLSQYLEKNMTNTLKSNQNLRTLLSAICLFMCISCHSEELESLRSIYSRSDRWIENKDDITYIGTRCSSLFFASQNLSSEKENKDYLGRLTVEMGYDNETEFRTTNEFLSKLFFEVVRLEAGIKKMKEKKAIDLLRRTTEIAHIYRDQMLKNNRVHNKLIKGWVFEDYLFCSEKTKFFAERLDRVIDNKQM
jgi:hypothetical protein